MGPPFTINSTISKKLYKIWVFKNPKELYFSQPLLMSLEAALVESLDGDGDAAVGLAVAVGERADEALVDAAEAALAELVRAAEVAGGVAELVVVEGAQLGVAPLLVERGDAGLRLGRGGARGLAGPPPRRARGVVGAARADG